MTLDLDYTALSDTFKNIAMTSSAIDVGGAVVGAVLVGGIGCVVAACVNGSRPSQEWMRNLAIGFSVPFLLVSGVPAGLSLLPDQQTPDYNEYIDTFNKEVVERVLTGKVEEPYKFYVDYGDEVCVKSLVRAFQSKGSVEKFIYALPTAAKDSLEAPHQAACNAAAKINNTAPKPS